MADRDHEDEQILVADFVQHAGGTDADPVVVMPAGQLPGAMWSRIGGEGRQGTADSLLHIHG